MSTTTADEHMREARKRRLGRQRAGRRDPGGWPMTAPTIDEIRAHAEAHPFGFKDPCWGLWMCVAGGLPRIVALSPDWGPEPPGVDTLLCGGMSLGQFCREEEVVSWEPLDTEGRPVSLLLKVSALAEIGVSLVGDCDKAEEEARRWKALALARTHEDVKYAKESLRKIGIDPDAT